MSVSLKVKIFDSAGTRIVQVAKSTLTIGSASHCDIVLEDPTVSPEHTRAWLDGGRIWIQDMGSPSGTALNDIRLPALKPMLVRDLDVLRLGESKSTLGLEPILVRAPVVKPKATDPVVKEAAVPEPKGLSNVELQKRREEAEQLAREVAELRLLLQMGNLEKTSAEEMGQQLKTLGAEVERVQEQKKKWDENLRQMEVEKQAMRTNIDKELLEFKAKALKDLKKAAGAETQAQIQSLSEEVKKLNEQRQTLTVALRQAEQEKVDLHMEMKKAVANEAERNKTEVNAEIRKLVEQKVKLAEALKHAEHEKETLHGKVLEKDKSDGKSKSSFKESAATGRNYSAAMIASASLPAATSAGDEVDPEREARRARRRRQARSSGRAWRSLTVTSVILGVIVFSIWLGTAYYKSHANRSLTSSSQSPERSTEKSVESDARKPDPERKFEPKQSKKYRSSYTENVLYLENYVAAEENSDFRKRWMTELNRVASNDWKVDTWTISPIGLEEQNLVQDLDRIRASITLDKEQEGIEKMRAREDKFLKDLDGVFKTRANVERFLKFKRSFYQRNQAYLTRSS